MNFAKILHNQEKIVTLPEAESARLLMKSKMKGEVL